MLSNKYLVGALTGLAAAVLVDLFSFRKWKSWDEAHTFDWRLALLRYAQGIVGGLLAAAGISAL